MRVALRHRGTGDMKFIETGWSWPIFWFAGFFGLPLFFRGLALWGTVMVAVWSMQVAADLVATSADRANTIHWALALISTGLCVFLGYRGNALSARRLIACGYEFAKPDSAEARYAMESWNL